MKLTFNDPLRGGGSGIAVVGAVLSHVEAVGDNGGHYLILLPQDQILPATRDVSL